jgi:hypothetical protein
MRFHIICGANEIDHRLTKPPPPGRTARSNQ